MTKCKEKKVTVLLKMFDKYYDLTVPHSLLHSMYSHSIVYFCILQLIFRSSGVDSCVVSPEMIWYNLNGSVPLNRKTKGLIKERLDVLVEAGLLGADENLGYIIRPSSLICKEQYVKCPVESFNKLKQYPNEFVHYLFILKTIYRENKIASFPLEYYAESEGCSYKSIINYNRRLEDLGVIYIKHGNEENNIYSTKDVFSLSENNSNRRRSVSAKYNNYVKNPGSYSSDQISKLYNDVKDYNDECIRLSELYPDYKNRIKDLGVFNKATN